jgi:hypothetical protein
VSVEPHELLAGEAELWQHEERSVLVPRLRELGPGVAERRAVTHETALLQPVAS